MRKILALVVVVVVSMAAVAQMASSNSAEVKKLEYFAGDWSNEATIAPGPWGAGGKFTDSVHSEWMKGGFFLLSHSDFSLPGELGGPGTSLAVLGYDPDKKTYTEERFDSLGRRTTMRGTLNGDTLTWTGQANYGGITIEQRMTIKETSPTSYTSKYDVSSDGGATWMPFWEGKATKK